MSEVFTQWDYPGDYLNQFPANHASVATNVFCYAVRDGFKSASSVLTEVAYRAEGRFLAPYESDTAAHVETMRIIVDTIYTTEARRFAEFILWREGLTVDVRERFKREAKMSKGPIYAKQAMASKQPTPKQLVYLRELHCPIVPKTRLEASQLIDQYINF